MQAQTSPVTVLRYGAYGKPGSPLLYERGEHVGKPIEYVDVLDPDAESPRRLTLDPSINGGRSDVGAEVVLTCLVVQRSEMAHRQDGRPFSYNRDKWRVLAMDKAPKAA